MSIKDPIYEEPAYTEAPPDDPFASFLSGFEVEQALAAAVRRWMPDYLLELERRRGLDPGVLPVFKTQVPTSFEADRLREDQLPALAMVSTGTLGVPEVHDSDGSYTARWRVDCYSVCTGRGNRQARRLAQWYAACVRALLLQWDLVDTTLKIMRVDWLGERYTTRSPSEERTLGEGVILLGVHVADVQNRNAGPGPMFEPGEVGLLPTVVSHDIVIKPEEE